MKSCKEIGHEYLPVLSTSKHCSAWIVPRATSLVSSSTVICYQLLSHPFCLLRLVFQRSPADIEAQGKDKPASCRYTPFQ